MPNYMMAYQKQVSHFCISKTGCKHFSIPTNGLRAFHYTIKQVANNRLQSLHIVDSAPGFVKRLIAVVSAARVADLLLII